MAKLVQKIFLGTVLMLLLSACAVNEYDLASEQILPTVSRAVTAKDPKICSQLPKKVQKQADPDDAKGVPYVKYPVDECLAEYATKTKDASACEMISEDSRGQKTWCYRYMAEVYSDPSICEHISGPASWDEVVLCRAIATLNIEECFNSKPPENLRKGLESSCVIAVVQRTKNPEQCKRIYDPVYMTPDMKSEYSDCLFQTVCKDKSPEDNKRICDMMPDDLELDYEEGNPDKKMCEQGGIDICEEPVERIKTPQKVD